MAESRARCCPIVELRRYTLHAGKRDTLITLFEREFIETQEDAGMQLIAQFRDIDRPDVFTWLRGFTDMLFGEKDHRIPVNESLTNIKAALKSAHNRRYTVRIFPNANHTLRVALSGSGFAWPSNPPGYLETLRQWTSDVTR